MRITQGTFSFLPELTDAEIKAQIQYAIDQGWACSARIQPCGSTSTAVLTTRSRLPGRLRPARGSPVFRARGPSRPRSGAW